MNELNIESLSATFYCGAKEMLTPMWHDKNVINPNSKIYYVLKGEIIVETDDAIYVGKEGDLILIPSGVKHNFHLTDENFAIKYWLHFDLKIGNESFFEHYIFPYKIHVGKNKKLEELFHTAITHAYGKNLSDSLIASGIVMSIVAFYFENCVYTEKKNPTNEIDRVIKHVKNNYSENFSLDELAKMVNLSPNYFVKKFKEQTSHSPIQFIKMIKLERAKFLLEQSSESVNAIMEQTGFYDSSHFSKLFKNRYGHSPKKYRDIYKYNVKK
ncbi:MAG: AraC family transcriptional regulator [Clostridia bacterium]|nr:AraC family transcriptional regulator [Clostridia bacterium]